MEGRTLADVRTPLFPHRHHRDGSFESICPGCFQTVGSAEIEVDLVALEKVHVSECSLLAERGMFYSLIHEEDSRSAA